MHDDEILGKAYDSKLMRRLLQYLRPYRKFVFAAIFFNILFAAIGPLRPYLTKIAIDDHIMQKDYTGLLVIIGALFGLLIIQGILQYVTSLVTEGIGQKAILDLRMQVFEHLQKLSLRFFDKNPIGRLVTRTTNDVESLSEMFSSGVVTIFTDAFTIFWILIFMFLMSWELSLVTLSVLPFLVWGTMIFRKKARAAYREVRKHLARMNAFLQEHISGTIVVQIFNREKKAREQFEEINAKHRDAYLRSNLYHAIFYPGVELISAVAIGLIIWYGGANVLEGVLTIGILISFIQYTEMFFFPIRDLAEKYNIMQTAMASSERIFKLLDDKTIISDPENAVPLESMRGEVEYKNVWFAYNGDDFVLRDVSFNVQPGETVALVGATGAGKSSIINLLTRFYDIQKGEILVDGTDIRTVRQSDLRRHIAIVLQDVFLFSGDIKTNISLGDDSIPYERIKTVSRMVGADRFIERLPNVYDEPVKERGATLSTGQKQLLSFARALAFDPKILILDEATSSVDTETELLIQSAIQKILKGRTSIVVAHRLSTIQRADKIIVLHKGKIREMGKHQELLAQQGIYYRLYQLQYKEQLGVGENGEEIREVPVRGVK
jgi:ATP-binding cassette, subfamily B, multidrug efflux pump